MLSEAEGERYFEEPYVTREIQGHVWKEFSPSSVCTVVQAHRHFDSLSHAL